MSDIKIKRVSRNMKKLCELRGWQLISNNGDEGHKLHSLVCGKERDQSCGFSCKCWCHNAN